MRKGREPRSLEDIVGSLISRLDREKKQKGDRVSSAWVQAVSKKTQQHSRPVSFKRGILMVIVENSTWLYELTMEKRQIIKRFNEAYKGRQKLTDIRYRVGKLDI